MAWTYWFLGGVLTSFGFSFFIYALNENDYNSARYSTALFILMIGVMFGVSSCIVANKGF